METAAFDEANITMNEPDGWSPDQCNSIRARRHSVILHGGVEVPVVTTCWKPTAKELDEIRRTGRLYLSCVGQSMPPVLLAANPPW